MAERINSTNYLESYHHWMHGGMSCREPKSSLAVIDRPVKRHLRGALPQQCFIEYPLT